MESKIILVIGVSDGIGKETTKTLARQGHPVIVHGRNAQKTQAVYKEIKAETGNSNIDMFVADLLSRCRVFCQ
jgi:short-subunit dehydrogenase